MKNLWLSDKAYDFIYSRVPRLCVDMVIKTPEGILLTKRGVQPYKDNWHLPGGRVLFRESLAAAAARIAKRELGTTVALKEMLGCIELCREEQNKSKRHSVSIVFSAVLLSAKIKTDFRTREAGFFKKLPSPTVGPHAKFLLRQKLMRGSR